MKENSTKTKILLPKIISVITIIGVVLFLLINFFYTRVTNATHKQALFLMVQELSVDDPKVRFNEIYEKYKTNKLKLNKITATQWLITIPPEFGATDWQLWIDFDNDKIKELKIRLSDSRNMHPYDAPPDKIKTYNQ